MDLVVEPGQWREDLGKPAGTEELVIQPVGPALEPSSGSQWWWVLGYRDFGRMCREWGRVQVQREVLVGTGLLVERRS